MFRRAPQSAPAPLRPLHRFLGFPILYIGWQRILGADRLRRICIDEFLKLRAGERVLDIGCGPGYILDHMPSVDYVGFDTEPRYIEYAMRHYPDRGRFFCGQFSPADATRFERFHAIMLFGVIHHLNDVKAKNLLSLLAKCLAPGGRTVTLDPCFVPRQTRLSRLVAQADRGRFVRDEPAYLRMVTEEFVEVETRLVRNVCRIPSTELIMRLSCPGRSKPT